MKWRRNELSRRSLVLTAAVFLITAAFLFYASTLNETVAVAGPSPTSALFGVPAATFAGTNLGSIPDGTSPCWNPGVGAPRNVTFNATGLSGSPTSVDISMTFGGPVHTFIGDVQAVLIAPNGASHSIFGRTLATTATAFGDSSDLAGPYTFSDNAPAPPNGGWWQAATAAGAAAALPTGTYRTTNSGGTGATNPQPPTVMNAAFSGVPDANGMWTLRLTDGCAADTGAIAAATLAIVTSPVTIKSRADFDGDGKTDLSVFRPSEGNWYLNQSTAGFTVRSWGLSTDIPAPGDFDGDNKTDTAIFRPSTGTWWILRSTGGFSSSGFGVSGDIPVVGDYNGDGFDDIAVFRPSNNVWYIQLTGGATVISAFGIAGDLPVRADYNGDGSTDIAVYRPSTGTWWIANSGGGVTAATFGLSTDKPVPADYDGDDTDDIAVFRPSNATWYIRRSSDAGVTIATFGVSTDIPVPGDYDGDGTDDIAIYRNGTWWLNRSTAGVIASTFGLSTDTAIPSKYIP